MNDDELIEGLRELAARTPDVTVDHDRVLALGRRRRTRRKLVGAGGIGVLCLGLVAGGIAWAGTTGPAPLPQPAAPTASPSSSADAEQTAEPTPWETYPASPDDGRHAVVDHDAGTVWLPEDDWVLSAREEAVVETARQYLHIQCLEELGYGDEVEFVGPVPPHDERLRAFGLWTTDDLALDYDVVIDRGAYWYGWADDPAHLNDDSIPGDNAPVADDPDAGEKWAGCLDAADDRIEGMTRDERSATAWSQGTEGRPDDAGLLGTSYRSKSALRDLEPSERRTARRAAAIVTEWEQCLADEGIVPSDSQALVPEGVFDFEGAYTSEQRKIMAVLAELREKERERVSSDGDTSWEFIDEDAVTQAFLDLGYTEQDRAFEDEPQPRPLLAGSAEMRATIVEADIRCKQTLGTIQRLADLDAEIQVQFIADNPAYFESRREISARMLTNATKVLQEAGVELP